MKKFLTPLLTLLLILLASVPGFAAWDEGVTAFRDGRFDDAADSFRSVVSRSPDAPQGHYMLGLSLLRLRQPAAALEPLARAVELQPGSADYRLALAQTQLKANRAGDALTTLAALDAGKIDEGRRPSYAQLLAGAATGSGRDPEAAAAVEKALADLPGSKALWLARSQLEERLGHPEASFEALATAYDLAREDTALGRRAVQTAFARAQDLEDEARLAWYEKGSTVAIALAETEPTPRHLRFAGEARMGVQDYRSALSWFERAAAADASDPLPRFYLARCALALEDAETALGHLDAVLERSPDADLRTEVWNARGATLRHLERFEDAAAAYRRAGNETKAVEMEGLLEIQENNETWEAEKRRCQDKQRTVQEHLAENDYLTGTEAWRKLEEQAAEALADCRPYLDESG